MRCFHCNSKKGPFVYLGKRKVRLFKRARYICEKCSEMYNKYLDAIVADNDKNWDDCPYCEKYCCSEISEDCYERCPHFPFNKYPECLFCGAETASQCLDLCNAGRCDKDA